MGHIKVPVSIPERRGKKTIREGQEPRASSRTVEEVLSSTGVPTCGVPSNLVFMTVASVRCCRPGSEVLLLSVQHPWPFTLTAEKAGQAVNPLSGQGTGV